MAEYFKMPMLGQTMEEGTILQWFKKEGDAVKKGEPLLEITTDKANIEVESPMDGVLRKILHPVDATVPIQTPIAIIGDAVEPIDALLSGEQASPITSSPSVTMEKSTAPSTGIGAVTPTPSSAEKMAISPRAQRKAREAGIDIAMLGIRGSGPQGRIIERDIVAFLSQSATIPQVRISPLAAKMAEDSQVNVAELASTTGGRRIMSDDIRQAAMHAPQIQATASPVSPGLTVTTVIPYKGMKRIGGETVAKSRSTAPHVTISMEADMTEASALLERIRPDIQQEYDTKLTYTDLLIKCVAMTLGRHPLCNASLNDKEILVYGEKNIGVAVALEDGLIVPVIKNADRKTLGQISVELKALANRCRTGKQTTEDLADGTFTITNLGAFGVEEFDPIIVPPQSCILGVCKIQKKPVVIDDQVAIRPMMNLCLSFDHRVLDGVPAAKFLLSLKETLEYPMRLLI